MPFPLSSVLIYFVEVTKTHQPVSSRPVDKSGNSRKRVLAGIPCPATICFENYRNPEDHGQDAIRAAMGIMRSPRSGGGPGGQRPTGEPPGLVPGGRGTRVMSLRDKTGSVL